MGWERVLLPQLKDLIDRFPDYDKHSPISPKEKLIFGKDRKDVKDLSPNHWELGIASELLRSAAYGSQAEWTAARDVYLYSLDLHLNKIGLWTSEQFTGAPHGGFYLDALVAARMAMWLETDKTINDSLNEYTRRILSYLHSCSTPLGEVVCCGERMPQGPDAPQQSAFYRELCGMKHPNARKINKQIGDDFWLSLRGLRKLLGVKDSIKTIMEVVKASPLSLPFTSQAVILEKWPTGHIVRYANSTGGDGTCRWVWVDNEKVKWGTDTSQCPPPIKPFQMLIGTVQPKEITVSVKENEFSRSQLWPASNHHWMAPGAIRGTTAQYGLGLDAGALRVENGIWEILLSRTPTQSDSRNSEWVPFDPSNPIHFGVASGFNRYGPGWSYGPGHNMHDEVIGYFQTVYGRMPTKMEQLDIEHDEKDYKALLARFNEIIGFHPEPPVTNPPVTPPITPPITPPVTPPVIPPVIPPIVPPVNPSELSTVEKRAMELLSLIPAWARIMISDTLLVPIIKEAIQAKRRSEERIIKGVIEGLKK